MNELVMSKLLAGLAVAGLMFGGGSAVARDTSQQTGGQDATMQPQQNPGSEAGVRRERDSTQQGETIPGPGAGEHPGDSSDATRTLVTTGKDTGQSSDPGDSTEKMRNRDSSKQQDPNAPPHQ
jgi:hypothetical protein